MILAADSTIRMDKSGWTQLKQCPLCSSATLLPLYQARDRHYGIQGQYQIAKCADCGLVFLNPMPDDSVLTKFYPETYYSYQDFSPKESKLKSVGRKLFLLSTSTQDPQFPKPGKMLDIGCGSGKFLSKMREKGWDTHGAEVSQSAARLGREHMGLDIFGGTILEANFPTESFDFIRSNHSFEHVYNPNETLAEVFRILKPGGKLHIGVPNIGSFNARFFKQYWWYLGAPVHTFNYSTATLSRMLTQHNFSVERVIYNSSYSGILGSWQIYANRNLTRISTDGPLYGNIFLRVIFQRLARLLDVLHQGDAIEVTATK